MHSRLTGSTESLWPNFSSRPFGFPLFRFIFFFFGKFQPLAGIPVSKMAPIYYRYGFLLLLVSVVSVRQVLVVVGVGKNKLEAINKDHVRFEMFAQFPGRTHTAVFKTFISFFSLRAISVRCLFKSTLHKPLRAVSPFFKLKPISPSDLTWGCAL